MEKWSIWKMKNHSWTKIIYMVEFTKANTNTNPGINTRH